MDSTGCNGNTALHYAAQNAEADVMEELIVRGLKVDLTNTRWVGIYTLFLTPSHLLFFSRESAIHLASGARGSHGDIRHVELLLRHGSNLRKERTSEGCTAAHYAAETGTKEVGNKEPRKFQLLLMGVFRFFSFFWMPIALSRKPR